MTAVGTCGAVVVAVGAPQGARWRRHHQRPKLAIEFGPMPNGMEFLLSQDLGNMVTAYQVSFGVRNSGATAATGVRAQLRAYIVKTWPVYADHDASRAFLRPQPLAWSSRPAALGPELREEIVLPPGESDVALVARYRTTDRTLLVQPVAGPEFKPRGPNVATGVEHWLSVSVTADNAAPVSATLWFETPALDASGTRTRISDAELDHPLPPAERTEDYPGEDTQDYPPQVEA
jgi:hypothetical protein